MQTLSTPSLPTDYSNTYEIPSIFEGLGSLKPLPKLEAELLAWIATSVKEGKEFITSSKAYQSVTSAVDIICNDFTKKTSKNLSTIYTNNVKRQIKEICATLSNIRPSWVYEANLSKDSPYQQQARILNGLSADWYNNSNVDISLKKLLELGTVEGTGYISPVWNPDLNNGEGGIELKLYRYNEVLPIQLGRDYDLQRAYSVILVDEMPITRARRLFPTKKNLLVPDRGETRMAKESILSSTKSFIKGFWDAISEGNGERRKTYPSPVVDILYTYTADYSINSSSSEIEMGEGTWKYTVPYIGQQIFSHYNPDGSIATKRATEKDCKLYPNRRLTISTKNAILYDGPSYWWHGMVPIAKYSPDEWVFSFLGFSMAAEVLSLDKSANNMRRDIEDALRIKIDPPLMVDENALTKTEGESNSIREPAKRLRGKLAFGDFVKPILPPQAYDVSPDHFAFVQQTEDKVKEILGVPDLKALQQARQIPSSDTVSQFFAQAGAIVTSMSRSLDPVMKFIADCNRYYFYQFYDLPRRIKILGENGLSIQDFDYDPATMVPQTLPNEPMENGQAQSSTFVQRAKLHLKNFRTTIEATSLHQITHLQRRLLLMQATKLFPNYPLIDPETIASSIDIPNWGRLEGDTIQEKLESWMNYMKDFSLQTMLEQGKVQLGLQQLAAQGSPEGAISNMANNISSAISSSGLARPSGRPPSYEKPPELETKPDMRTTISTS